MSVRSSWVEFLRAERVSQAPKRRRRSFAPVSLEPLEKRELLSVSGGTHAEASARRAVAGHVDVELSTRRHVPAGQHVPAGHATVLVRRRRHRRHGAGATDPAASGSWTPPTPFRPPHSRGVYVAIHMALLPNGMVLSWPHDYNYFLKHRHAAPYTPGIMLWDPATNTYKALPVLKDNIFCSGATFLPNGDLIILGGHGPSAIRTSNLQTHFGNRFVEIYHYQTNTWTRGPKMAEGRYYGSSITLGNGQVIAVAGYNEYGGNDPLIELYTPGQGWHTLSATTSAFPDWYPHIYQLSNGLVFGANPGRRTFFIDPTGAGRIWQGPSMNYPRRFYSASVMYAPNQILAIGGDAARGEPPTGGSARNITNTAETINLDAPNPTWQYTGSMRYRRYLENATLLPDGTVLVTGGTSQQDNAHGNALRGAVRAAELWDPKTGRWTTLAKMKVPRLYHSTALLLPDGRVLVAGGGEPESTGEAVGTVHQNMQIFSPPYLFRGPRPVIGSAPSSATYGQTIDVTSPDAASITTINLVRTGFTTHDFNMTQRIVSVPFTRAADGTLKLQMPTNPNDAPPGPYMLFLLNGNGVPSTADMISLDANDAYPAPTPSSVSAPTIAPTPTPTRGGYYVAGPALTKQKQAALAQRIRRGAKGAAATPSGARPVARPSSIRVRSKR